MKKGYSKKPRKTTRRKATFKSNIGRSISPKTYQFKRSSQEIVDLTQSTGQGWLVSTGGGIAKTFEFKLSDLNDNSDFTNLFKYYKINAVRVQMYFSNSITSQDEPSRFPNSQLFICTDINQNGIITGSDSMLTYLDSQTAKKTIGVTTQRKPIDMLMRMKIANEIYESGTQTAYTLKNPAWIDTAESGVPHFGMNMLIERVDGQALTTGFTNPQYVRFIYTYYIECKKVQ